VRRPAAEKRQGTKSRVRGADRAAGYGDLVAVRDLTVGRFSTGADLEWGHNLEVTARMLLYGENNFFAACDFKQLRVAERAHSTTST
jgi:hypothetical protein